MGKNFKVNYETLVTCLKNNGAIGQLAIEKLEHYRSLLDGLNSSLSRARNDLEMSERQVRDQARTIEQLNRENAQLRSSGRK